MEQTSKLKPLVSAYVAIMECINEAGEVKEVDELKLRGVKAFNELERQINRARPELNRLAREVRGKLSMAHYQQIAQTITTAPETTTTEPTEAAKEVVPNVEEQGKKTKKEKKAKK